MTRKLQSLFAAVAAFSLVSASASADLVLDLEAASTSVVSGGTVDVKLILRDTDSSHFGPMSGPLMSNLGLVTGSGKLIQSASSGATASVPGPGGVSIGDDFPFGIPASFTNLVVPGLANHVSAIGPGLPPTPAGVLTGIAHIATFAVQVDGLVGQTVTVSADTLGLTTGGSPATGNVIFGAVPNPNLDDVLTDFATTPANFGSVTLTVAPATAPIPEPSSLLLGGLLACGLVVARRRRFAKQS